MPLSTQATLAVFCLALPLVEASAENWNHWRGPRYDGVSSETGLATEWAADKNVLWRAPMPGPAGSTPVVIGDRVFVTSVDGDRLLLIAFSTSGDELWSRQLGQGNENARGDEGNFASPSPTTDGESVVAFMGSGDLACFDMQGQQRWRLNVQDRYGELNIQFGMSSSPILHEGRVYLQLLHGDGDPKTHEARVVALDASNGEEIWSSQRITDASDECEHAYTSPMLYGVGLPNADPVLVTHGADYLIAYALDNGHELWRCGGMNSHGNYHKTLRFVASPAVGNGLIVAPTAKKGPVLGVRPGGTGDLTDSDYVAWRMPRNTPDVPTPLIHDGLVYLCAENGVLRCLDADSGQQLYQKRLLSDRYRASPVLADGKLYCIARKGVVSVVRAGREFELLAENDLGEATSSSLAIANGVIYQRTFDALYAIAP